MEFVGAGIAFPMRTDAIGGVALVAREREIQEAIRLILGTAPGERPMRPEFGCRISEHVFAPANATTAGQLRTTCGRRSTGGSRGSTSTTSRSPSTRADTGVLYIDITYRIRGTNDPRNLVFPFYVIPAARTASSQLTDGS